MIMNKYCVYAHINKINNKAYIGITSRKPEIRWGKNGEGYKQQIKFYNAIQKYGWDNFEHKILIDHLNEQEALELESIYIENYNSIDNGYNVLQNGISSYPRYKPVYCITTNTVYDSIKEAAIAYNTDPSRIIANCKGKNSMVKGVEWTYWNKELNIPEEKPEFIPALKTTTPIYCIELNKTFPSIATACKELNLDKSGMMKALNGTRNGIGGFHFVKENEKDKISQVMQKKTGKQTQVYCIETKELFSSLQEAAKAMNVGAQSIMKNCQGKTKTCKGKHFKYYSDLFNQGEEEYEDSSIDG